MGNFHYDIFVGNVFVLKIFVGSMSYKHILTRKFYKITFVMAFVQHMHLRILKQARAGVKSGRTYGESNYHVRKELLYSRLPCSYIKKCGRLWLDRHWCTKGSLKTLPIDTLWLSWDIFLERCHRCVHGFCTEKVLWNVQ